MFNRWHKEVLARGRTTTGTVIDTSHVDLAIPARGFSETYELRLLIRVAFPDGTSTEFTSKVPLHEVQHLAGNHTIDCWPRLPEVTVVGASVPVRYDRSDDSRILLDLPALVAAVLAEAKGGAAASGPDA
jgi:hypothetical protein